MRVVVGVILGYLLFAGSAVTLFSLTHHNPHAPASATFEMVSTAYGILFALLAGYIASYIGGRGDALPAMFTALLVAAGAIISMIMTHVGWSQVSALAFMTPSVLIGGRLYALTRRSGSG